MANIRIDAHYEIKDGTEIVFRSPVDCSKVTGLIVYYTRRDGNTTAREFAFADAHGNNVGDIPYLFAENVVVKVILDVTTGMAFVQNADTNAYIERTFAKAKDSAPAIINTAEGVVVSVPDSVNRPLHGLKLYGKTTQSGTPAPDAPIPLVSAGNGGNISVTVAAAEESQTLEVYTTADGLPGIPVDDGWISDEINLGRGVYVQRVQRLELNGSEGWLTANTIKGINILYLQPTFPLAAAEAGLCTHYPYDQKKAYGGQEGYIGAEVSNVTGKSRIWVSTTMTAAEFKSFLAEHPVTVMYPMAEPVETALDDDLIAEFSKLHSYKPNTTVSNDAGAEMKLEYVADTKTYVDNHGGTGGGSGGNVDQATPESFGAKGDGVTDDSAAIAQTLAASKNVVFDGDKTYAVGSTIVIPADAMVDFRGATIVPTGNHDVIRVMPGSLIENIVVRCTGVPMWDSSAVVLYGGDRFRAYNPTVIKNVKLYNNTSSTAGLTTQGVGIKLYGDQFGDFIEGITVEEASTYGFGIGILFEGVADDTENTTGGIVFIGANKFRGYWSFYDNQGIVMPNKFPNTHITNNIFTDLQIEPKNRPEKENQSSYGIYCQGFSNYFDGCLYDFFYNHTAVYFGSGSARNVLKTTANPDYDIDNPVRYVDLGINNTVTTFNREKADLVPYTATTPRIDGNQDDWFAFIDRRANCTLESFDGEPVSGSLANVFDPTPHKTLVYKTINPDVNNRRARITINCDIAVRRLSNFYMQFYSAPKSIKVTFYNNTDATVVYDTDNNVNDIVGICSSTRFAEDYEYNVAKIVIELGGFSKIKTEGVETYGTWELVRIMAVDSYRTGNVWMRRDGGEMYGNIKFTQDKGVVLRSASGNKFLLTVSDDGTLSTSQYIEPEEEAPDVAVLTPTMLPGASWYNVESSGIEQNEITSVVFDSAYVSTGEEDASWACDEDENGNIMAYRNGTAVTIKSTTGSDCVKLNPNSAYMFANDGTNANFAVLANVGGTDTLRADNKTSASNMFNGNKVITGLIYIPEGVTEMTRAFNGCTALTTPPVLPDGLANLNTAFFNCSALLELPEIPASVTNINYAFQQCTAATKAPSTIPAKVSAMAYAFRNCVLLTGTIAVDATAVNSYSNCFESTGRDTTDGIMLTGSSPYLAELAATAGASGKVTVAT